MYKANYTKFCLMVGMYGQSLLGVYAQAEFSMAGLLNFGPQDTRFQVASAPTSGRLFIGFPGIGRISAHLNNRFSFRQYQGIQAPAGLLSKRNALGVELIQDNLLVGYKDEYKRYYGFSSSHITQTDIQYPKALIEFLWEGNAAKGGETTDLSGVRVQNLSYREWAFTFSMPVAKYWRIGARVRYLQGIFSASMPNNALVGFYNDPNFFEVKGIFRNSELRLGGTQIIGTENNTAGYYFQNNNHGGAIDLGFSYEINSLWKIEVSLRDLGFIRWKEATRIYSLNQDTVTFRGVNLRNAIEQDTGVLGALEQDLELLSLNASFDTFLHTNISTRTSYYFAKNQYLSASGMVQRFPGTGLGAFRTTIGIAYTYRLLPHFTLTAAVARYPQNNFNLGLGIVYDVSIFQFYLTSGNVIAPFSLPRARAIDISFGINIITQRDWGQRYLCP